MEVPRRYEGRRFTDADRALIYQRVLEGKHYTEVAAELNCSLRAVYRLLGASGKRPQIGKRSELRLSLAEREEISRYLHEKLSLREIARRVNRSASTISREVSGNGGRLRYRAWRADDRAVRKAGRPRKPKLAVNTRLREKVEELLSELWSPQQISAHLVREYAEDSSMRISHESIYQALFVQGRGSLRKELTACLRTGRTNRRAQGRGAKHQAIVGMVMISDRPAEAEDRAVPGHWEGDLIIGKGTKSAIGTLVERKSRYVILLHLPNGRSAEQVREALTERIQDLPASLRRSLTWDQGREMAQHADFTVDTGVQVFFCDPHSPWQRGSNENANGLLRQYFPKGTDLSVHDREHLDRVAEQLNRRPRKTLDWKSPAEAYTETVAMTN